MRAAVEQAVEADARRRRLTWLRRAFARLAGSAIVVQDGAILSGSLPRRALGHVQEWRQAHVAELEADWQRAKARQPLTPIEPLE